MKKKYIISIIIAILIIGLGIGIYLCLKDDDTKTNSDAIKFASEYTTVTKDNVFVYRNAKEIINILEHGTGVVYLGFPECPWCQTYVKYLNEVAINIGVEKIYYFNILEDRTNNTEDYKKIVSLLENQLQYDEEGNERIFVPHVTIVREGKLVGYDFETSKDTLGFTLPNDYWNEEKVTDLKEKLHSYMLEVIKDDCLSCDV